MGKQYHFVVVYDVVEREWRVEPEVSVNFSGGDVWDTDAEEWSCNTCDTAEEVAITKAIEGLMFDAEPVDWIEGGN